MIEHPIPQDITGYRFHIVGNMTLKQFAEVGIGAVIAAILYKTGLPNIIKWPILLSTVGIGALAAFIPIEERPLDHWIITFIKVMYKPTQYFWKRRPFIPSPFTYQPAINHSTIQTDVDLTPARRARMKEFMASIQNISPSRYDLDPTEKAHVNSILSLFRQTNDSVQPQIKPRMMRPQLDIRVRKLGKSNQKIDNLFKFGALINEADQVRQKKLKSTNQSKKTHMSVQQIAKQISIPQTPNVNVELTPISDEELVVSHHQAREGERAFVRAKTPKQATSNQMESAFFNASLPFPSPPTEPDKLVGMVLTPQHELIPGAIVEVKAADGYTARAVKSNALGQFYITTPLKKGQYVVETEKEGFRFEPRKLKIEGKKLPPMEIQSV